MQDRSILYISRDLLPAIRQRAIEHKRTIRGEVERILADALGIQAPNSPVRGKPANKTDSKPIIS